MSLRDQAIADLPTFINVGEFGDTLEIDGVPMACALFNDEAPDNEDGISVLESTLYVPAANFAVEPDVRQRITVGARQANITRVDEEQGMLAIRLHWFNS
jgi:hypothetical protein